MAWYQKRFAAAAAAAADRFHVLQVCDNGSDIDQ